MKAVDELGTIQAQIAELRIREKELKGEILNTGDTEGDLFKAAIIEAERNQVAWKDLAMSMDPSHQRVRAYTDRKEVTQIRVTARSTAARAAA